MCCPDPLRLALISLALLGALPLPAAAAAARPEPPVTDLAAPPVLAGPKITLGEAVTSSLRYSYELAREAARVSERHGAWREAQGTFDPTFFVNGAYNQLQEDLVTGELANEIRRRVPAEFSAIARPGLGPPGLLDFAADLIESKTPSAAALIVPDCTAFDSRFIVDAGAQGTITLCVDASSNLHGIVLDGQPAGDDLARLIATLQVLEALGANIQAELQNSIRQILLNTIELLRSTAAALRIQRARLGAMPDEQILRDFTLELGNRFLLHNGTLITATLGIIGTEDEFASKPHAAAFGGQVSPDTFTTTAALRVNVPLGRGRGRLAAYGPVQAAESGLEAEERILLFTATNEALRTVGAYWNLAAAQQRLVVLEKSVTTNDRTLEQTRELIRAAELPGVEERRAQTRAAEAKRRVAEARRDVLDARLELVRAMGAVVETSDQAPLAADPLPTGEAAEADEAAWFTQARGRRYDVAAAAATTRAATILRDVARANLRRPVDFVLRVSYSGFDESFETRIWDLGGYSRAAGGKISGPSYSVGLRVSWPFGNSTARGQLLQAESTLVQTQIDEIDLLRDVGLRVADVASAYGRRRAELLALRQSLADIERSLDAALERFKLGDITLIDVLTTETQATDARLAVIEAERALAVLEAQVRFETGGLLTAPASIEGADPARLQLVPFASSTGG